MRDTIRNFIFYKLQNITPLGGLFEGGGVALPDYASREGCRVEVQDSREEAGREFGRL